MNDRETILGSLGTVPGAEPLPTAGERIAEAAEDIDGLWTRFADMLEALGGRMATIDDLNALFEKRVWIDADAAEAIEQLRTSTPLPPSSKTDHLEEGGDIWDAEVGITTADLAIAETGTVVLSAGKGRTRLSSLAPPVHVVLVRRSDIVATLEEAMPRLGDRTTVFITGPSRTADIEGILIRGVHGPGELRVVPI